jgi:hypothetical protein
MAVVEGSKNNVPCERKMFLMKKSVLWIMVVAFCATTSFIDAQPRFQTTFSFTMGFPQGEFGDNVDDTGLGMTAGFNYRIGHSPVLIGGSFGFLQYGSVSRLAPLGPDIPDVIVEVDTNNNILMAHFLVRYEFGRLEARVKPYAEGLVGIHYLWTQTSIDDSDDDDFATTNFDDTTGSFGAGGGVLIGLYHAPIGAFNIDLDLGVRFMAGGEARYLTEGSIIRDNGNVTYLVSESDTHIITTNFGVIFSF